MVVVSHQPVLQPLSALANQNTAAVQNSTANSVNPNATTIANTANLNSSLFDGLISKFKASNTTAQQATAPVAQQVTNLTQLLTGQVNQNTNVNSSSNLNNDNNLSTNVSINNLNANLTKWQNYLDDNDYSFTLKETSAASSGAAINVNVINGQVSSASYADGTAVSSNVLSSIPSIEEMFADIRQANANGERTDALYNPTTGHPQFVFFGHTSQVRADDVSYSLSNVNVNA
mgnify:CR=1 FL=1